MKSTVVIGQFLAVLLASAVVNGAQDDSWFEDDEHKDHAAAPDPVPVGGEPNVKGAQIGLPSAQGPGGSHGSNYAGFNQKCAPDSEPGIRCSPTSGLTCDMRLCKCRNSTVESDLFSVYYPVERKCFQVSRSAERWACEIDLQCTASTMSQYSRCNYNTNRCECAEWDEGREIMMVDDVCYVKKEIGSQCQTDVECQVTIKGNAVCLGTTKAQFGRCDCAGGYAYEPSQKECLQAGRDEDSNCKLDTQCSGLGELVRCNPTTGKCKCYDTPNHGQSVVEFYALTHTCYYKRKENERCESREECYLGMGSGADCIVHAAYNNEKVCQCPVGRTCGGSLATTFSILLLVVSALLAKSM